MSAFDERPVVISSGGLELEGARHDGTAALSFVMLHPHPQYGGSMDSHVVTGLCRALAEGLGATTLRFNVRGAGRSGGTFDGVQGAADDARAAIASLADAGGRLLLAGYSFGAMVAASVAPDIPEAGLLLVSPPTVMGALPPIKSPTVLLVTGDRDAIAPAAPLAMLAAPHVRVRISPGVDHSWWPGMDDLARESLAWARTLVPA